MDPAEMERLWDAHTKGEFADRDVEATMATMVDEPYVMHLPTLMGGRGRDGVRRFYSEEFIPAAPADIAVDVVSRTVGTQRVVDEMVVTMTHDREVPWLLPGVPATGARIEVAVVGVIGFTDGLIDHEHIWWDQASVLVQAGLLSPDGLPVYGTEVSQTLRSLTRTP